MTAEPRRLRLGALVLCLVPVESPRLWRVVAIEGEDAAAEHWLAGQVFAQTDLAAWKAGQLSVIGLGARRTGL